MSKELVITFAPGVTTTLPWPMFGQGDELPPSSKWGRVRSGSLRSYITTDVRIIITSWSFDMVLKSVFDLLVSRMISYCNTDLTVAFKNVDGSIAYSYVGKFRTPVMETSHDKCDYVSFQTQFTGVRS